MLITQGGEPEVEVEKEREKIKKEIASLAVRGLDIEKLAKKYSMLAEYFYIYECCNAEVHSLPSAITEYFDKEKNDFVHYPGLDEFDSTCVGLIIAYLKAMDNVQHYFRLDDYGEKLAEINEEFMALYKET
jgi:hypothetical protein